MIGDTWYRYYDLKPGKVFLSEYRVIRETQHTAWLLEDIWQSLDDAPKEEIKKVLKNATKRYCAPTREEAMTSFLRRKEIQLKHLRNKIVSVETAVTEARGGKVSSHYVALFKEDFEAPEI